MGMNRQTDNEGRASPPRSAPAVRADRPRPSLVLVDGSSYLYRAFHAMPHLSTSRGEPTGAIYGVVNMLRRLLKEYDPHSIAVVFDAPGKTFRDELYAAYKAQRPPMPAELAQQIAPLKEIIAALGLPIVEVAGVEADDVIGTLARRAAAAGGEVLVSTGDKDMAQLVGERIRLVDTMTDTYYDRTAVVEKFGVPPERIVDWLALVGDSSDNIPGVPGVGPKTAAKWLQQYGSLEEILRHAGEIPGKAGEGLRALAPEQFELARALVTIRTDLELPVGLEALERRPPDRERLRDLYQRLEFKNWLAELEREAPRAPAAAYGAKYETILEEAALRRWVERLRAAGEFAFDTETSSLDAISAELVGVSFACAPGEAAYVPLAHRYPGAPAQIAADRALALLKPLLEDAAVGKICQNAKYDLMVLTGLGIALAGLREDTMLESYVLDSSATRHDMDSLALKYLGYKTLKYEEVAGKGKNQLDFREVPVEQATAYAAEDADVTLRLHRVLRPRLAAQPALERVYREIEMPLVPVLARMERHGVMIDAERLRRQSDEIARRLERIEEEIYAAAGERFNLGSPKQIQAILFEKLKLPVLRKTPTGQPSTAEEVLAELALDYPLPALILEHRGLAKLKSTYTDKLPQMVHPRTGRVHTSYNQAVAATGRLSSSEPNLQNIPIRTEEGRRIRQAFIAPEGWRLMSADYSQIELRIMAHLSGDAGLIRAFAEGRDIHRVTAAEVFGVPLELVSEEMRRHAKAINFGLIYGMSGFGLARQLRITREAAEAYIERYFARYPGVKAYMERTREQARAQGYVETLFGRRLYLPEIKASNQARRAAAERAAINAPMQGTAADLIKLAMIAVDRWIAERGSRIKMIMQVHDELVFEVPEDELETARLEVRRLMEGVAELSVPLVVDIGVGANWDEAH
jgi:DNA polymerase-1